jgi:hypothetical protein
MLMIIILQYHISQVPITTNDTTLHDKVCQWLATGWWSSHGTLVSSTNKTEPVSDVYVLEEFEDTKGVIRIHILKNRQHNGQKKKDKRTNNDL